jgi:hypothetical protein
MKDNVFSKLEMQRKSSDFSIRYESVNFENSPRPVEKGEASDLHSRDNSDLEHIEKRLK